MNFSSNGTTFRSSTRVGSVIQSFILAPPESRACVNSSEKAERRTWQILYINQLMETPHYSFCGWIEKPARPVSARFKQSSHWRTQRKSLCETRSYLSGVHQAPKGGMVSTVVLARSPPQDGGGARRFRSSPCLFFTLSHNIFPCSSMCSPFSRLLLLEWRLLDAPP